MVPAARPSGGGSSQDDAPKYKNVNNAKELFDLMGETLQKQAHEAAKTYKGELEGTLSFATASEETNSTQNPCIFEYDKLAGGGASGKRHPCRKDIKGEDVNRFSDKQGAQCDYRKIRGSKNNINVGACAPYRRLHVCDKNMENMVTNNNDGKAKHDLLAEVCMAAKHECESLKNYHDKHQLTNSHSQLCTELARSFADIGDIVRGRDLYRRDKGEETKLEKNLKKIFAQIYDTLQDQKAKERYKDDPEKNYYKLREDWWELNRQTVWKAITCSADTNSAYFRQTCNDKGTLSHANHKCRCSNKIGTSDTDQVPTYFDYVPQYLRWFEEWAEDFCRKKKKQLPHLKTNCRGENGKDKYCSGNGYDCERTIYKKGKLVIGYQCTNCSVLCRIYEKWIDNQKQEFLKQRNKYEKEMQKYTNGAVGNGTGRSRKTRAATIKYEGYEKKFYEKLKESEYGKVDAFLKLLNKENECKDINEEKEKIDFAKNLDGGKNENDEGTFYHSEYCEVCPGCGMKKTKNGGNKWEEKSGGHCDDKKHYKILDGANPTDIDVLSFGDKLDEIKSKMEKFCAEKNGDTTNGVHGSVAGSNREKKELIEKWQCYKHKELEQVVKEDDEDYDDDYHKEVENGGGLCVLRKDQKKKEPSDPKSQKETDEIQKTFNDFFYFWIRRLLNDSIYWRGQVGGCLKNGKKTCGNQKCKGNCECFLKWITQKQQEWGEIKKHFNTQDGFELFTYDFVLKFVLQKGELLTSIKEGYGNSQETEAIRKMMDEEEEKEKQEKAGASVGEDNTTIDKLLQHELKEAEDCLQKQDECEKKAKPPIPSAGENPASRSLPPLVNPTVDDDNSDHSDPEEEEEEEEEEEDFDDVVDKEEAETHKATEETTTSLDVCKTVADIFNDGSTLKDACKTKYDGKYYGWRCVAPSGNNTSSSNTISGTDSPTRRARDTTSVGKTTSSSGAICVPPRRRKLYIGKLEQWVDKVSKSQSGTVTTEVSGVDSGNAGSETQPQGSSNTTVNVDVELRNAFIQSAAVEMFFLWDRYKKIKDKEIEEKQKKQRESGFGLMPLEVPEGAANDEKNPEEQLKNGEIPEEFKRQMFYTLGDYRDICVGVKDNDVINALEKSVDNNRSGEKSNNITMKQISEKIEQILKKQSSPPNGGPKPVQTPKEWWEKHAEDIWKGMVCALTYKENDDKKVVKDTTVDYTKLTEKLKKENGEKEGEYHYSKVTLKDENSGTEALAFGAPSTVAHQSNGTPLADFIHRPSYFRWLEEWGESFCRERAKRLEEVEKNCKQGGEPCSGDGENCKDIREQKYDTISSFNCPGCGRECRKYKNWIRRKKYEFIEQQNAFTKQKDKCVNGSTGAESKHHSTCDQNFVENLRNGYQSIDSFLQKLVSCSKNNKDNGDGTINFKDTNETFKNATNCKPCFEFSVNCNNGNCMGGSTNEKCKNNGKDYITAKEIEQMEKSPADVIVRVSDNSKNGFEGDLENDCKNADIFKGVREDKWKCFYVCGVDICEQTNANGKQNGKQYIQIKALLKRWVENFLEDYKKIKHKISHCKESDEKKICIKNCVDKWVELKKEEWKTILKRYFKQYNVADSVVYEVRTFLEGLQSQIDFKSAIKPCNDLTKFERSIHCNGTANSENGQKRDVVECLLENLGNEAKTCETPAQCQESAPTETPPEEPLEEEENPVIHPQICGDIPTTKETVVDEGTCDAVNPNHGPENGGPKEDEEGKGENGGIPPTGSGGEDSAGPTSGEDETQLPVKNDKQNPEETDQVPDNEVKVDVKKTEESQHLPPALPKPPPQLLDNPPFKTALMSSIFAWSVGIGFAALTYWLIKKKTKRPVNLFSVMEIPKGHYDIPTFKSSNRYIPYASGKYRGKRYIYIEGDSGTDSGYTDHYSDITSSSESEYEELDINDIYPYQSPKYKTLIEVVLEPSTSDNTPPTSDIPSDTPSNKFIEEEWNQLKRDFISNMLQNTQNTEPNILHDNVDNNTHSPMTRHNMDQKPFITSIHDRNLYTGEEYSYDMSTNSGNNDLYSGIDSTSGKHGPYSGTKDPITDKNNSYSGTDLINDSISGNHNVDIYDQLLKRKENELFGTNHTKHTTKNIVAKQTHNDPILNQINLFHKWLDRHKNMCEQWDKNKKEELLDKLKKEWEQDYNNNTGDIHNRYENVLNTDVSIQINMNDPKPINQFTNMDTKPDNFIKDTILDDLEKHREPYFYDIYDDDITYFDIDDEKTPMGDIHIKEQTEMNALHNNKMNELLEKEYPISDIWNI